MEETKQKSARQIYEWRKKSSSGFVLTIEEIRKNAPDGRKKYRVNADGSVDYRWKNNEGMQWWSTWCWLGVNTYGMELKPL